VVHSGRLVLSADASEQVVDGTRSMGLNPLRDVVLPPHSRTVVEFSVRATVDAEYLAAYEFRVTDVGETFAGAAERASCSRPNRPRPLARQRIGVPAGDRPDATVTQIRFELNGSSPMTSSGGRSGSSTSSTDGQPLLRFALVPPPTRSPPHGSPSRSTGLDQPGGRFLRRVPPKSRRRQDTPDHGHASARAMHLLPDGVTAPDVQAAYAGTPENDPADRAYYRHEPRRSRAHLRRRRRFRRPAQPAQRVHRLPQPA
jgi:hypothetical protein